MPETLPIAVTSGVVSGSIGVVATLDGSGSTDPNGEAIVGYVWTLIDKPPGSSAVLSSSIAESPTITPDVVGTYRVFLKVTTIDGRVSESTPGQAPDSAFSSVRVTTTRRGWIIPAAGERDWAGNLYTILSGADNLMHPDDDVTRLAMSGDAGQVLLAAGDGSATKRSLVATDIEVEGTLSNAGGASQVEGVLGAFDANISSLSTRATSAETRLSSAESRLTSAESRLTVLEAGGASSAVTVDLTLSGGGGVGNAMRINGSGEALQALATSEAESIVAGVVTAVDGSTVTLCVAGVATGLSGLTPGARYYVSSSVAGSLTATAPSAPGQYVAQVGIALTTSTLLIQIHTPIGL